jgi:hypothetical protein
MKLKETQDQPRPIISPLVPNLLSSSTQLKPIPFDPRRQNLEDIPRKKELIDELGYTRVRYDMIGEEAKGVMHDVLDMGILDRSGMFQFPM